MTTGMPTCGVAATSGVSPPAEWLYRTSASAPAASAFCAFWVNEQEPRRTSATVPAKYPAGNGAQPSGNVVPPGNVLGGTSPTAAASAVCLIVKVPDVGGFGGSGMVALPLV